MKNKKIILAFSGGLDTSFCVLNLKEQGFDVITLTVDTGGFNNLEQKEIASKSKKLGTIKHIFVDGKTELYENFISYIIKGNLLRGGVYPLCVGPERIIIAKKLSDYAKKEKADAVAHGSTGAGNDQVRFDTSLKNISPKIKILTPIRNLEVTRVEEMKFLKKYGFTVPDKSVYSINQGLLGTTIGGKETTGSWESLPDSAYPTVVPIVKTPDKPEKIIVSFYKGLPKAINGKKINGVEIMKYLNFVGAKHGVGKNIHLGNTILGIKGRVGFEAPGATILIKAHIELEKLVLTKWQSFWKEIVCNAYGNFLHESQYFDPVVKDMEKFIDSTQNFVTGDVKVTLFKGNCIIEGVKSQYSLMNAQIATYGEENHLWNASDAKGFIKLYGLQSMMANVVQKGSLQ